MRNDSLECFLTYADNNAVGYFAKQGFTKEITFSGDRVRAPHALCDVGHSTCILTADRRDCCGACQPLDGAPTRATAVPTACHVVLQPVSVGHYVVPSALPGALRNCFCSRRFLGSTTAR